MEYALYLLQVSGCVIAFYVLYIAFFRNSTFFRANRIYLLVALLISFIIPGLEVSSVVQDFHMESTDFLPVASLAKIDIELQYNVGAVGSESFNFIAIIYWIGFGLVIARLLYSIARLIQLKRWAGVRREQGARIVRTDLPEPFSFFNLIFLPKEETNSLILQHERAHVRYHHWLDLLFAEFASAALWFNPVMIFYKKSIKIQHEYEADCYVIRSGASIRHYLDSMLHHLQREKLVTPISQFYSQNIKKRIIMITRKKTPLTRSLFYMLIIPVGCLLSFAFAKPSISNMTFSKNFDDRAVVIVVDAGHGGGDSGSSGNDGLLEKDFALSMARNIQKVGEAKNITVILTRTGDNAMNLEERVNLSNRHGADAFISIHSNYDQANIATSGIACVVSEKNSQFKNSQRLAENLVEKFRTLNGIPINGIKKSNAYILKENKVPAILVELGYFSNQTDYVYMNDKKNQLQISERIIDAVLQFTK